MTPQPPRGVSVRLVLPDANFAPTAKPSGETALTLEVGADMAVALQDRSAERIDASAVLGQASEVAAFALLVECRRVLSPGARLACGPVPPALPLDRFAGLAGLVRCEARGDAPLGPEFAKPQRQVSGDPMVSLVIPAFSPRFFAASLASAVAQTYEPLEIVVCDDSSGDEIASIVKQAARERPVRYLRNPHRLHTRGNLARGLDEARGEFIKYLNDDDQLVPDCVAQLIAAFRSAPDIVLATSWRRRIDEHARPLPDQLATMPIAPADVMVGGASLANAMLLAGLNVVGEPSTVLFRRADFEGGGQDSFAFDGVAARGALDFAMWASLLLRGDAVWYRRHLSDFRIHPGQSQQDVSKRPRAVDGIRSLQRAWLGLGLPQYLRPSEVLLQPFPPGANIGWQWARVPALARIAQSPWGDPPSGRWRYGATPRTVPPGGAGH